MVEVISLTCTTASLACLLASRLYVDNIGFGPNLATFVFPTVVYPIEIRATMHGLSAGCGKTGALIGALLYPMLVNSGSRMLRRLDEDSSSKSSSSGVSLVMFTQAVLCICGYIVARLGLWGEYGKRKLDWS